MGKTSSDYARSVVNTVREPLVVLDNKFRVISANRAFYTTFKVTPETSENTLLYDLGDGQWDIPRLRELLEKVLPKSTTIEDFEVEHDFPDIGQKTMLMNARRIQGETGATQMILLAIEDITERKRLEDKLKYTSEYAQNIVNTVREPLVVLDNKFRVISANRAFYTTFKVNPEMSENTLLFDLGNRQWNIPRLRELLEKVLPKSTTIEDFEVEHDFPDIGQKTMLMNARRIQGETGATQMILLAIEDITERRLVEAELHTYREHLEALVDEQTAELKGALADLERSNAELQQFAYVASHDLQEPLRMVASYLQLLEKRYKGMLDDDADDFIHYAVDGALRMQRLIHDLLELSRIATREQEVVSTDATVALDAARANLEFLIEECGGTVTNDTLPTISANEVQFAQLMQNLVANALKFRGEEPPRVHVSAKQESNEWVFSVRDNGIGFEPEQAERIFTIFQRLNPKSAPQGTGIGLAISKSIVEKYGGRIWTESVPGEGSTFYFTVPLDRGGAA